MKDKYLPIGSVVILKNASKKIMIAGYLAVDNDVPDVVYDYSGCLYPEGFLGSDQSLLFNHDQIKEIFFLGFVNSEQEAFGKKILEVEKELKKSLEKNIDTLNIEE